MTTVNTYGAFKGLFSGCLFVVLLGFGSNPSTSAKGPSLALQAPVSLELTDRLTWSNQSKIGIAAFTTCGHDGGRCFIVGYKRWKGRPSRGDKVFKGKVEVGIFVSLNTNNSTGLVQLGDKISVSRTFSYRQSIGSEIKQKELPSQYWPIDKISFNGLYNTFNVDRSRMDTFSRQCSKKNKYLDVIVGSGKRTSRGVQNACVLDIAGNYDNPNEIHFLNGTPVFDSNFDIGEFKYAGAVINRLDATLSLVSTESLLEQYSVSLLAF